MEQTEIRDRIKDIVSNIANIPVAEIADDAAYIEDLDLDSLALLEIGVDVDYAFQLNLPEEAFENVRGIPDAVALVAETLASRVADTAPAAELEATAA